MWGRKLPFHKEFGLRALISFIVRTAARLDLVAKPILSYGKEHYIRVFFSIDRSPSASSKLLKEGLGWVEYYNGDFLIRKEVNSHLRSVERYGALYGWEIYRMRTSSKGSSL